MRSPIRPSNPSASESHASTPDDSPLQEVPTVDDPETALTGLRGKMERVARDFANGKLNRAQFNAIYGRYDEQRKIIERLIERDPENPAWHHVAEPGHTAFLLNHFQARPMYYIIYRLDLPTPLMMGGKQEPDMRHIEPALRALGKMSNRPRSGLARKSVGSGQWLVLALGEFAVTMVMFMLEPSTVQLNRVRDLHADFERANRSALERGTQSFDRMVFPQRALVE
ncbi:MAG: hypothetical protein K8I30_03890 [Anaerolineae bacterium]|nr:hypothetical protein [Anaerolineae bacterium]